MKNKFFFILTLLIVYLHGDDIDVLLGNIQKRTDLSEKTKLANSGVSFVWTRDDLDRMQITNLKQVLNTMYPFGYAENRFGLTDPLAYNSNQPSMSATIRLFIDNQEITTGLYGSGLILMGNTNIDWVDHIEIYTQSPTYEYATESTVTLIKLYTKSVKKDEGSKIKIEGGSYGKNSIDAYNAGWLGEWSYFVFGYAGDEKRKKYKSHQTTLSRDKTSDILTATFHKNETNILLHAFRQKADAFANLSLDATPQKSTIDADYLHLGIDSKIGNFSYLLTCSYTGIQAEMLDDVTPISAPPFYGLLPIKSTETVTHDLVFTTEIKYKKKIDNDTLLTGVKYRTKHAKWDKSLINGIDMASSRDESIQNIASIYLENQYMFTPSSLFTAGAEYQHITNQGTPQKDNLWMYRIGYTYRSAKWTSKTLYAHTLSTLEPYLVDSKTFLANPSVYYKPQEIDTFVENLILRNNVDTYELIIDYSEAKNYYLPNKYGKVINYDKIMKMSGIDLRWTRLYRQFDKLFVEGSYRQITNTPVYSVSTFKEYRAIVRNINTYKKIDIFNELMASRNNFAKENYYNYSLGIQYHYTDDILIGLKGINIFDDARNNTYYRINPNTLQPENPLHISPIDREVLLSASWTF